MTDVWNISVDNSAAGIYPQNYSNHLCGSWCSHTADPIVYNYNWTSSYPTTIYMYQIKCPSCNKMNWAQLETTIDCKNTKCKAKLRAVTSKPEHIVEVEA